jgi:alkylhydroperoxidase family enzyme
MAVPLDRDAALALLPGLAEAHATLHAVVWDGPIPAPVLERCRLRSAQLHGAERALAERSPVATAAGFGEADAAAVPGWPTDASLDDAARACLAFTELFVIDPHAIADDQAAAVVAGYGEAGLVALTTALGLWENVHRFDKALRLLAGAGEEA